MPQHDPDDLALHMPPGPTLPEDPEALKATVWAHLVLDRAPADLDLKAILDADGERLVSAILQREGLSLGEHWTELPSPGRWSRGWRDRVMGSIPSWMSSAPGQETLSVAGVFGRQWSDPRIRDAWLWVVENRSWVRVEGCLLRWRDLSLTPPDPESWVSPTIRVTLAPEGRQILQALFTQYGHHVAVDQLGCHALPATPTTTCGNTPGPNASRRRV